MTAAVPAAIASAQVETGRENHHTTFHIEVFSFNELASRAIVYGFDIIVAATFLRSRTPMGHIARITVHI
jgi:hypothetical protein